MGNLGGGGGYLSSTSYFYIEYIIAFVSGLTTSESPAPILYIYFLWNIKCGAGPAGYTGYYVLVYSFLLL